MALKIFIKRKFLTTFKLIFLIFMLIIMHNYNNKKIFKNNNKYKFYKT